eukprot:CAMPEP_0172442744 /NCGR_PEP_ID=MMETSP1065-20121228/3133_1 /TAXON_ID=265537 /ORGANISM="Amphiprora paludosa, Strain CCMP125" /LENGTH=488 /DNA_ID=CAMNT_0013192743 /DNA_START=240 /DNA_END=1706 /DNA_ORIENTATION=-
MVYAHVSALVLSVLLLSMSTNAETNVITHQSAILVLRGQMDKSKFKVAHAERHRKLPGNKAGKYRPPGDPDNCVGYDSVGGTRPCRMGFMENLIDQSESGMGNPQTMFPNLFNQFNMSVFVSVPPTQKSISPMVTVFLTSMWNETMSNMEFHLPQRMMNVVGMEEHHTMMEKIYEMGNRKNRSSARGQKRGGEFHQETEYNSHSDSDNDYSWESNSNGIIGSTPPRDPFGGRHLSDESNDAEKLDLYHVSTLSKKMMVERRRVIWRYDMTFAGYWAHNEKPVNDAEITEITSALMNFTDTSQRSIRRALNDMTEEKISFATNMDDFQSDEADGDTETPTPSPTDDSNDYVDSVDSEGGESTGSANMTESSLKVYWDTQRIFGLILLSATVAITVTLVLASSRRQERRNQTLIWANLNSEEGVSEMLGTGWALKDGKMEIFDKSRWGYSDDSSVFRGGFQQKETPIGAEISITVPSSSQTGQDSNTVGS